MCEAIFPRRSAEQIVELAVLKSYMVCILSQVEGAARFYFRSEQDIGGFPAVEIYFEIAGLRSFRYRQVTARTHSVAKSM